ncbi:hypothetical protein DL765_000440 [Monosporascus sp. GIB2]|nr:hypothetical protein DL765_000440 [Monosporascus sp. GIB2]
MMQQEPVAIIGYACRLPGGNSSPEKLWEFLERGGVASSKVPQTRFNFDSHYDGSRKPGTMRPPGGMFLEDMDPADFDAAFFEISGAEAISMDPNQRQMLEVVFEGLENAGLTLERLNGASVACFVASFATGALPCDSLALRLGMNRDPLDRAANHVIGIGRASMANRLSYFLNIKGPSVTLDTACSGSMVGLHLAVRALHNGEADAAIVATSNIYLNPEHVQDVGSLGQAHSPTGLCHTFDVSADGYIKSEAVSSIIVKRLADAIRDRDPIRAVIRGTASTSNGRTNGLASPSSEAQAAAIRQAYVSAGITNFNDTAYLECHGTGTPVGDPTEVNGAGSVFAPSRAADKPLLIGSIKSNIGHSEPAAGSSGVIKAVMCIEKGIIPGTPTFINPNPKSTPHCFCLHVSAYQAEEDLRFDAEYDLGSSVARPYTLVVSANDEVSLRANIEALCKRLINPRVQVHLADLAYTLSERRSRFWHRAFVTTQSTGIEPSDFVLGKKSPKVPRLGFVFTGQGAQWPQMAKDLLQCFPRTRAILEELDLVLQRIPDPPRWSLVEELTEPRTAEHLRQPEFSQPLVTALQLAILAVLISWGVEPSSVVGHSSGEIAAAYAAGFVTRADAIKAAFYRGRAAVNRKDEAEADVGMLAVGLNADKAIHFLHKFAGDLWIACFNSPSSLTISGRKRALVALADDIRAAGHFARLLQVDLAYHSGLMAAVGEEYETLLTNDDEFGLTARPSPKVAMFSSVSASKQTEPTDALYWKTNMVSPVRFSEALTAMVSDWQRPDILIEIGPSGALAGPVAQVLKSLPAAADIAYFPSWSRGSDAANSLFNVAGRLFNAGAPVDLARVNHYDENVRVIVDLPNYSWNRSIKYWFESAASLDWRFKPYVTHDLIGSKVLSSPWQAPSWRKRLNLADVPWLRDHAMGSDVLVPAAGYITMALEAMYQKYCSLNPEQAVDSPNGLAYRFRDVRFERALVVEDGKPIPILLSLAPVPGSADWHEFRVSSEVDGAVLQHCRGRVRVQDSLDEPLSSAALAPLKNPTSAKLWYKAQNEIGMRFGPAFQNILSIETTSGQRNCRARLSLAPPKSKWEPQSYYPIHPAVLDACFQSVNPALMAGERSNIQAIMIPAILDDIVINKVPEVLHEGLSVAESVFTERGRKDQLKSYLANVSMHDPDSGALFDQLIHLPPEAETATTKLNTIIDLVAHKKPLLRILEANIDGDDTSSLWFQDANLSARAAYSRYDFASTDAKALVSVQTQYENRRKTSFLLVKPSDEALGLPAEPGYDFAIIKAQKQTEMAAEDVVRNLKPLLAPDAFVLLVALGDGTATAKEILNIETPPDDEFPTSSSGQDTPSTESDGLYTSDNSSDTAASSLSTVPQDAKPSPETGAPGHGWNRRTLRRLGKVGGPFSSVVEVDSPAAGGTLAFLCRNIGIQGEELELGETSKEGCWNLVVLRLDTTTPKLAPSLQATLETSGWTITQRSTQLSPSDHTTRTVILVLDELSKPLLTRIDGPQWDTLKALISSGIPLLWVTKGAQHDRVTDPDRAMVHGLFRVARREDPTARLTVLDVQSGTSLATAWAVDQVLRLLRHGGGAAEAEYVERDGVLHTQRVVPDEVVNAFKRAELEGTEPVVKGLHETDVQVHIHAERVGTLDLAWCEEELAEPELEAGVVEVEVKTVGVNFKDVATTMGIVPENEFTIGCECAGLVRRLGPDSVLIHSAAGGVGLAAIQLAQYKKAEIFVTVGTEEKRQFLTNSVGIPPTRIFSSRNTEFAEQIMRSTNGRGVDVILNSLTGELLDASWRICADGGTMVEIGKRDIVDRNSLAMEPFDRNCSFRAIDLSYTKHFTSEISAKFVVPFRDYFPLAANYDFRLLDEIFGLVEGGHIKPIHPVTTYGFDAVPAALAHIRRGQHIGKIVITNGDKQDVQLPIRPALRQLQLQPNVSYLIVGGLKGLCGSLAIHMAHHGARHIISCSRSGLGDEASAKIMHNCRALGCEVTEARGNVADAEFVRHVFKSAHPRIAGVIQGAMILRDKPYETMTVEDYHAAIESKVLGTWNLHHASREVEIQKQPLDFFTMLSSISGVIGNKGQANYAAGNTFLDAFASYRHSLGLVANTVDLGAVQDVGYVAEAGNSLESRFDRRQWTPINEGSLRRILTYSFLQQDRRHPINPISSAQLITGIAYPLQPSSSDLTDEARFGYLFGGSDDNDGATHDGSGDKDEADEAARAFRLMVQHLTAGADTSPLAKAAVALFSAQITKLLRLENEVEPGKPLAAYGLDSLSAVEIRGWARVKLGVELSTFDITNASSIFALCEKMVTKLVPLPA